MPLHTNTTIRIERKKGLIGSFASLQIREHIHGHHTFSLALPGRPFGAGDGTAQWRDLVGRRISFEIAPIEDPYSIRLSCKPKFFSGLITGLQLGKGHGPGGHVVLTGGSPTLLADDAPHTRSFTGWSLREIAEDALGPYPVNVLRPKVDPRTTGRLDYVVQYQENTWQFLRRLARTYGEWFYYNGQNVVFGRRDPKTITLTHDVELDAFTLGLQLGPPSGSVTGYDYGRDEQAESAAPTPSGLNPYSQGLLDEAPGLFCHTPRNQPNSRLGGSASRAIQRVAARQQEASVAGMVTMSGASHHPGLVVGDHIFVDESVYGREAYGTWMLTAVHHSCSSEGDYSNHFSGVPADVAAPPHWPGDHPHAQAQSAVVTDNNDPEDLGRVQVRFRWQQGGSTPWLRTIAPAGGAGKGLYMIPERGEEVMVGFTGGHPERPYVLGGTWNGGGPSGFGTETNDIKAIKTRSGNEMVFDDNKGDISLHSEVGKVKMNLKGDGSADLKAPERIDLEAKEINLNAERITISGGNSIRISSRPGPQDDGPGTIIIEAAQDMSVTTKDKGMLLRSKSLGISTEEGINLQDGKAIIYNAPKINVE